MVRGRVVKGLGAREKLRARAREKLFRGKKEYGARGVENCEREQDLWASGMC